MSNLGPVFSSALCPSAQLNDQNVYVSFSALYNFGGKLHQENMWCNDVVFSVINEDLL